MVRLAAFDLDHTLTRRDCVVPFLRQVAGTRSLARSLVTDGDAWTSLVRRDRDALKAVTARAAFAGRDVDLVRREAAIFAARVHASWMRDDTVGQLHAHVAAGDVVILVSASFEVYGERLAAMLGAQAGLGTRLGEHEGRLTGALAGPNCRGPEKVVRLRAQMRSMGLHRSETHVVAYGDSAGDRQLLAEADVAHWTRRYRPGP